MRHGKLDDSFMGPAIYTEGEEHVNAAWELDPGARRQNRARKALEADLDNIDAYALLAMEAKTAGESIALLREAVRVGERLWAPCLDDPDMHWWGFMGTRPWMRAMHMLAMELDRVGDADEAEELYRRLLDLNPNDNQGVRGNMIRCLMAMPRITALRGLLAEYSDDGMLEPVMAGLWLALRKKNPDMAKLGPAIDDRNPFVLDMLAGVGPAEDEIEKSPYGISLGGADEAEDYLHGFADIWAQSPKAIAAIAGYVARRTSPKPKDHA